MWGDVALRGNIDSSELTLPWVVLLQKLKFEGEISVVSEKLKTSFKPRTCSLYMLSYVDAGR